MEHNDEQHSQPTILVVDDDPTTRQVLARQLSGGNYNFVLVEDGYQALDFIARTPPDLILLDIMMPGMNGVEVVEHVREHYSAHFIPIILISALGDSETRVAGIQAGANDFVTKPYNLDELRARVRSMLSLKATRDQLRAERDRLALLYDVSRALGGLPEVNHLLAEIVRQTTQATGAVEGLIVLLDENGEFQYKIQMQRGEMPSTGEYINPTVLRDGLLGWVIANQTGALVPDVTADPRWVHLPNRAVSEASAVAVPLAHGQQVIGALLLVSDQIGHFDQHHLELSTVIASQATIALENARFLEQAQRERSRVEALLAHTADAVIVTDPQGCITRINPAAQEMFSLSEDMLGRPLEYAFNISVADLLLRAQERGGAVSGEFSLRGGGQKHIFYASVSPVSGVGYMLLIQNITPLKELEDMRLGRERAETQRVLDLFSRYMSPALVERVLDDTDILRRRERREAVVMFADMRGFTRLTTTHPPDRVIHVLDLFFSTMTEVIYHHEGVIFDLTGDELLVGFNVPYDQPDASQRALAAAIEMHREFFTLKQTWAAEDMQVGMGVGIDRGPVVIGNVGGPIHMNYQMVGEAVVTAHRLVEQASDGQIIASQAALADMPRMDEGVAMHQLEPMQLRGKPEPVTPYLLEVQPPEDAT
jgi:PAS domain S-box-containing protein